MSHVILPEPFEQQRILLVHEETLAVALVLLEHTYIPCALLRVLESPHPIVVPCLELSDVFRVLRCHLAEALGLHIVELTSVDRDAIAVVVDALACRLTVDPHAIIHFIASYELSFALAMRLVVHKHASVDLTVCAGELAETFLSVTVPLAFIFLPVVFCQLSVATLDILDCLAFIALSVFLEFDEVLTCLCLVLHFSQRCLLQHVCLILQGILLLL